MYRKEKEEENNVHWRGLQQRVCSVLIWAILFMARLDLPSSLKARSYIAAVPGPCWTDHLASSGDWLAIPLFTAGISQRVPHKYRLLYLRIIYVTWFIFLKRRGLISMLTLAQLFLCHPLIVFCCDVLLFLLLFFGSGMYTDARARFSAGVSLILCCVANRRVPDWTSPVVRSLSLIIYSVCGAHGPRKCWLPHASIKMIVPNKEKK